MCKLAAIDTKLNKLDSLDAKLEQNLKTMENLKSENNELKIQLKEQQHRISVLERETLKRKVIVFGLKEEEEENEAKLERKVKQLITSLGIELNEQDIQETRRLGREGKGKERPTQVEVATTKLRNKIMREKKKLKEISSDIWIEEAMSKAVVEQRRELVWYMKEEKMKGNKASIKYNKLIINGKVYTMEEIKAKEERHMNKNHQPTVQTPQTTKNAARTYSQRSPEEEEIDVEREKIRAVSSNKRLTKNQ